MLTLMPLCVLTLPGGAVVDFEALVAGLALDVKVQAEGAPHLADPLTAASAGHAAVVGGTERAGLRNTGW